MNQASRAAPRVVQAKKEPRGFFFGGIAEKNA